MDKKELRRRFDELSRETNNVFSSYVRSTDEFWRALVRSYLWWHECQAVPELLDEIYEEYGVKRRTKPDNTPNFRPFLQIVFGRVELQHERERITFWKWGCALNALHIEHSENPQRYRSNAEGKLFRFFADAGGVEGLTKKENNELSDLENEPLPKSKQTTKKLPNSSDQKIQRILQERARSDLKSAKGIGTAVAKRPLRVGEDGLIAVLARRESNGKITILGSSNAQSAIDHVTEHLLANDITHLPANIRVIAEVIRTQAYPSLSMPSDPAKRLAWYRSMLLDNSPLKVSDVTEVESGKKKEYLKAPSKLLIRGKHSDIILSGSKAQISVVTCCRPKQQLINKVDQVFLRVMERSLIERMLETGEIHLLKVQPSTGLKRSKTNAKHTYELTLDNGVRKKPQTLHFYDANEKAGMLTGFQAGFEFDLWKPNWSFRVEPVWFGKLREQMLDQWFASLGAGKQPNRPNNVIMQAFVTAKNFGLVYNIYDEKLVPQHKEIVDVRLKTKKRIHKTQHLSKDIGPVLFNLADVHSDGLIEVSGNDQALVFAYKNDLGSFQIAVPTAERKKKSAVRNSTAFSEIKYG